MGIINQPCPCIKTIMSSSPDSHSKVHKRTQAQAHKICMPSFFGVFRFAVSQWQHLGLRPSCSANDNIRLRDQKVPRRRCESATQQPGAPTLTIAWVAHVAARWFSLGRLMSRSASHCYSCHKVRTDTETRKKHLSGGGEKKKIENHFDWISMLLKPLLLSLHLACTRALANILNVAKRKASLRVLVKLSECKRAASTKPESLDM